MFSSCKTTKDQGNIGVGYAIAYFTKCGFRISIPINDSQDYDLIVDDDGLLYKVQVKTTKNKKPSGNFEVQLRSTGGTNGSVYKRVCDTDIDLLFVLTNDGAMYNFPYEAIKNNTNTITLCEKYSQYKVT